MTDGVDVTQETLSPEYDASNDASIEVTIQSGYEQLVIRYEYPIGTKDPERVLRDVTEVALAAMEDGRF